MICKLTRAISDRFRIRYSKAIYKSTLLCFIFALQQTADIVKFAMTLGSAADDSIPIKFMLPTHNHKPMIVETLRSKLE